MPRIAGQTAGARELGKPGGSVEPIGRSVEPMPASAIPQPVTAQAPPVVGQTITAVMVAPPARPIVDNTPECFRGIEGRGRYKVSFRDKSGIVVASNRIEAWAIFCDQTKTTVGPKVKGITIEWLGTVAA